LKQLIFFFIPLIIISCAHVSERGWSIPHQTPVRKNAVPYNNNSSGIFSVLFLGDILLVEKAEIMIQKKGADYPFHKIKDDLSEYTFCVANMESPVTRRGKVLVPSKPFIFRIDPIIANTIADVDPTCLIIGNNHIMDYGVQGMLDTISWIESKGWYYCGAGKNLEEARSPAVLTYANTRVVLLSYNERPPEEFYATRSNPGTTPLDITIIKEDIRRYKQPGTVIIVNPHWGLEMTIFPRKDQRITARTIIDMGADAVIGQHPHCPQGIEIYNEKIIFYSIGNFITGYTYSGQTDNMAVALFIDSSSKIIRAEVLPVAGKNLEDKYAASLLQGIRARQLLHEVSDLSLKYGVKMVRDRNRGIIDIKKTATSKTSIAEK
jgi:poly-gamma-glutamate capsule biosynthesis protein CapA/YwtB (metallophosphatase superfamily)